MVAVRRFQHPGALCGGGFVKQIRHIKTLFYYDRAQIFEARDAIGGHYVAVLAPTARGESRYLVVGVNPERLRQFRLGVVDLRSLLIESDREERYLATAGDGLEDLQVVEHLSGSTIDSELLPDTGFTLHDDAEVDYVVSEARERHSLVLELSAEPPEAATEHRIRVDALAELLFLIQALVRYAYRAALKEYPVGYRRPDDDLMDVIVPASAGSFRFVLAAANPPDLFGASDIVKALVRVDALFQNTESPEETLTITRKGRGHFAGAYLKLLKFLVERETGLRYSWAEPSSKNASRRAVSYVEAANLLRKLSSVTDLGQEDVVLNGRFESFNRSSGAWGLVTPDGLRRGKIRKGGPNLDGLEVGAYYIFHCEETIEEIDISGRESRTLYLNSHESMTLE